MTANGVDRIILQRNGYKKIITSCMSIAIQNMKTTESSDRAKLSDLICRLYKSTLVRFTSIIKIWEIHKQRSVYPKMRTVLQTTWHQYTILSLLTCPICTQTVTIRNSSWTFHYGKCPESHPEIAAHFRWNNTHFTRMYRMQEVYFLWYFYSIKGRVDKFYHEEKKFRWVQETGFVNGFGKVTQWHCLHSHGCIRSWTENKLWLNCYKRIKSHSLTVVGQYTQTLKMTVLSSICLFHVEGSLLFSTGLSSVPFKIAQACVELISALLNAMNAGPVVSDIFLIFCVKFEAL